MNKISLILLNYILVYFDYELFFPSLPILGNSKIGNICNMNELLHFDLNYSPLGLK